MNRTRNVAVLVGSLRRESYSRRIAMALAGLAPPSLALTLVEIAALPLFNQDLEKEPVPAVTEFKRQVAGADALLFVTPEYNRSVPGVLKNAIDVGSRPHGQSVWGGKPAAVVSVSVGGLSGFGANHHLRQSLVALNVPTMAQPEAYIGNAAKLFDEHGALASEPTREFLRKFVQAYASWVERNALP